MNAAAMTSFSPAGFLRRLWAASPPMMVSAAAHLVALAAFVVLAFVDQRVVNGQLTWIKPAKFAISQAVYLVTLAWVMSHIEGRRRALSVVSWVTGVSFALELGLITLQAGRGVVSHFNVSTPFDETIWFSMGLLIAVFWLVGLTVPFLLLRQRFADPALGSALRAGVIVAMIGAAMGGLMPGPNQAQMEALKQGQQPERVGAHAVGVKDGGAGLPVMGWSTEGGDLRIAHFFGLHALQALPLAGVLIRRRGARRGLGGEAQRRLVRIATAGYLGLIGVLTVQALRAEPLIAPSPFTLGLLGALAAAVGLAWAVASRRPLQVQVTAGGRYSAASAA